MRAHSTVNFDSLVEMPSPSVRLYLRQTARVSRAFYHMNRVSNLLSRQVRAAMPGGKGRWRVAAQGRSQKVQWSLYTPMPNDTEGQEMYFHQVLVKECVTPRLT